MGNKPKQVLFIDPLLQIGHVNFNNIYIESLRNAGYQLNYIFVSDYEKKININKSDIVYSIPKFLFKKDLGKIGNRFVYFISLLIIRVFINLKKYDVVIFSSFEEISFFLSGIKNSYIINHINVSSSVKSTIKLWFLKKVLNKNSLIVFDETTKKYLTKIGNYNILVQPHGLANSKKINNTNLNDEYSYIFEKVAKFKKILFSPSESSSDIGYINELIVSDLFLQYLEKENMLFIFKGKSLIKNERIFPIDFFLSQNVYDNLFLKADSILIAYSNDFKYRVSGVLFECMANYKPCAVLEIEALKSYDIFFNYNPFYSTIKELIQVLEVVNKFENRKGYYKNLNLLNPNFNNYFENVKR